MMVAGVESCARGVRVPNELVPNDAERLSVRAGEVACARVRCS